MKKFSIGSHFVTILTLLCLFKVINSSGLESTLISITWFFECFAVFGQMFFIVWMTKILNMNLTNTPLEASNPRTVKSRVKTVLLRILAIFSLYAFYTHGHIGLTCVVAFNLCLSYILRQLLFNFYDKIHGK